MGIVQTIDQVTVKLCVLIVMLKRLGNHEKYDFWILIITNKLLRTM